MKSFLTITLLSLSVLAVGQDYKLFNASSRKVFTNYPIPDSTLSIAFDSVRLVGTDSVYYNFTQTGIIIPSDTCHFWGGQECIKQDRATWLGSRVIYNNASIYKFFTANNDSLNFDFSVTAGDSALIFENTTDKLYLAFAKTDTITVLNFQDSARFYTIIHTDASGNTINSLLNQKHIIIAKTLGLVQFFQVNAFPEVLNPVYLLGNVSPDLGLAKLTNETVYNFAVGDVFQYHDVVHHNYGPPGQEADLYTRYTITGKVVLSDSVYYTAVKHIFEPGNPVETNDFIMLKYKTNEIIAQIPYEYTNPADFPFISHSLRYENYCGTKRWTYRVKPNQGLRYCSIDNCWGANDVPGPAPTQEDVYTLGFGLFYSIYSEGVINWNSPGYHHTSELIFSRKNGVECGTEAFLGVDENPAGRSLFSVYPVPAKDILTIETSNLKNCWLSIQTINGREVQKQLLVNPVEQVTISSLKSGIYLVKLTTDKTVWVEMIVKE